MLIHLFTIFIYKDALLLCVCVYQNQIGYGHSVTLSLTVISDSRPKLVAGSADGYAGHVDGKLREAKMNHPKGITVDDKGNIYIADTDNMAIRKISDAGNKVVFVCVFNIFVLLFL